MSDNLIFLISIRCDNDILEKLSLAGLWSDIKIFSTNSHWWFLRVQNLFTKELEPTSIDWRIAYHSLSQNIDPFRGIIGGRFIEYSYVKFLLELGYDPTCYGYDVLVRAVAQGCIETVKLLLADRRVDPTEYTNEPLGESILSTAICRDKFNIVKLLLEDGRFDPEEEIPVWTNCILHKSSNSMKLLLVDPRMNITMYKMEQLIEYFDVDIVQLGLSQIKLNEAEARQLLDKSIMKNRIEVVKFLLDSNLGTISPEMFTLCDNPKLISLFLEYPIRREWICIKFYGACIRAETEVVKVLLHHPEVCIPLEVLSKSYKMLRCQITSSSSYLLTLGVLLQHEGISKIVDLSSSWLAYPAPCRPLAMLLRVRRPTKSQCIDYISSNMHRDIELVLSFSIPDEVIQNGSDSSIAFRCFLEVAVCNFSLEEVLLRLEGRGASKSGLLLARDLVSLYLERVSDGR